MRQKGFFMSLLPYIRNEIPGLREALDAYTFPEMLLSVDRYGKGHINDTFCAVCQSQEGNAIQFIIQRLSNAAFPHPEELMENFVGITSFLRNKILADGGDPTRETLSVVKTKDGRDFYTDANGRVWRLMPFIENTDCYQSATPELFEASARTFGRFQRLLNGESGLQDVVTETMETITLANELRNQLHRCIAALPKAERELIHAIYFEGMTEAEYASKANMTQSGISRRRKKTLSKLKKLLNIMGSIG